MILQIFKIQFKLKSKFFDSIQVYQTRVNAGSNGDKKNIKHKTNCSYGCIYGFCCKTKIFQLKSL